MILIPETPDSDSLSRSGTYVTMLFDDEACCSQAPVLPFSGDSGAVVEQTKLILAAHACANHTFRVRVGARGWIVDVSPVSTWASSMVEVRSLMLSLTSEFSLGTAISTTSPSCVAVAPATERLPLGSAALSSVNRPRNGSE
eukprot:scaffold4414_cov65-Phaeocystis_antarctica.AAC.7